MGKSGRLVDICKKMQCTRITLQAKDSLPIMDSSTRLAHFFEALNEWVVVSNDNFC